MQSNMDQGRNRVFINPNFNKGVKNSVAINQMPLMHVNPYFNQHVQNVQPVPKAKIYINPNFVKPNGIKNEVPYLSAHHSFVRPNPLMDSSNMMTAPVSTITAHGSTTVPTRSAPNQPIAVEPYPAKSRYSYVRQKGAELPQPTVSNTQTHTVKISKYKSINITDMKKNLDSVKPLGKSISMKVLNNHASIAQTKNEEMVNCKSPNTHENKYKLVKTCADVVNKTRFKINCKSPNTHENKYKLVKPFVDVVNKSRFKINSKSPNTQEDKYKFVRFSADVINKPQFNRQTSITSKSVVGSRTRIKVIGVYKKNNIPCPQFRKYGKCLRNIQGKCVFLHDKKHVSICRKFITGVCHDEKCLLSHELSDKKMPTCYFYLKGMCIKEGCPYLHVKLNDKAKICPDFIRGYCDKGDKCLDRHVIKSSATNVKRRHSVMKQSSPKLIKCKMETNKIKGNPRRKSKIQLNHQHFSQKNDDSCGRYYKESVQEVSSSEGLEVIKPSRCKLGTLPSFIQL